MSEIKRMDLNEFRDLGFLQEVNRLFFHPRGLALEVIVEGEGDDLKVTALGGIWDSREDPEGIVFCEGPDKEKAKNVRDEAAKHTRNRARMFGWITQPVGVRVTLEQLNDRQ